MPSATHARTVADRCRKATFEAPGSLVRGTVRISTSKPAPFWGRQRKRTFQVTKSWSKAMTSKWKYRISVRAVILSLCTLFSLSSNLTSEERPERPINEQALVAACAPGLPHKSTKTPTSPGPHSMRAGSAMSLRRGSLPTWETSRLARGSQLLSHSVRIAPLHLIKARLVNQALTLGEGRNQPAALLQHALIAQCAQHRLHALHRALKSSVGV